MIKIRDMQHKLFRLIALFIEEGIEMLDKGFRSSISLDQPGKIMVRIKRPMAACRFIEIRTEGVIASF